MAKVKNCLFTQFTISFRSDIIVAMPMAIVGAFVNNQTEKQRRTQQIF